MPLWFFGKSEEQQSPKKLSANCWPTVRPLLTMSFSCYSLIMVCSHLSNNASAVLRWFCEIEMSWTVLSGNAHQEAHRKPRSMRKESFFEGSKISLRQGLNIIYSVYLRFSVLVNCLSIVGILLADSWLTVGQQNFRGALLHFCLIFSYAWKQIAASIVYSQ